MRRNQNVLGISAILLSLAMLTGCVASSTDSLVSKENSTEGVSKLSTTTASTTLPPQTTTEEPDDESDKFIEFDSINDYNDYLATLDRTNEVIVMTESEFADFISTTYPTAQQITFLFTLGSPFEVDDEMPVHEDSEGNVYEPFLTDTCHSLDDLWTYIGEYYTDDGVEEFKSLMTMKKDFIIELDGVLYCRQGVKGTTAATYSEQAELVYQQENKITYSLPIIYGGDDETKYFRLCTLSKDGDNWKYESPVQ